MQRARKRNAGGGDDIGDEKIRPVIAMMMMAAAQMVVGLIARIGRIVMMRGRFVMTIMHGVDRETVEPIMVMRHHEGRRMLDLISGLGGHCRRIEHHQRDAERRDQAV